MESLFGYFFLFWVAGLQAGMARHKTSIKNNFARLFLGLRSRRPATGVSRALRARSVPGVSPRVSPENGGCPRECPTGCPPRAPERPKSVPRVSRSVKKVSRTLRGHSRGTFWTLRSPGPEGPRGSLGHPHFRGISILHLLLARVPLAPKLLQNAFPRHFFV